MKDKKPMTDEERAERRNENRRRRMYPASSRDWESSHIRCLPYVEREAYDRSGRHTRDRGVEEMLRLFRKRVAKSGITEAERETRFYEKPSTQRRARKQKRDYDNEKRNDRERENARLRGDRR